MAVFKFYGGVFSNFYNAPVVIDGVTFPTTEHYFQAMKFAHLPDYFRKIATAKTPGASKMLGNTRRHPLRHDWEAIKDDVMYTALKAKFTQHPELRRSLLETKNMTLVEDSPNDYYWGCGKDGTGKNRLGELLMRLRSEFGV